MLNLVFYCFTLYYICRAFIAYRANGGIYGKDGKFRPTQGSNDLKQKLVAKAMRMINDEESSSKTKLGPGSPENLTI